MTSTVTHELTSIARDVYISRFTIIATVTCLVYDYILTFGDEKRLIWSSHLSTTKLAFFVNRYMPFLATVGMMHTLVLTETSESEHVGTCRSRFLIFSSFILAEFLVAAFIIYTRAYAVWGCKRSMLVLLSSAYTIVFILAVYFAAHFISSVAVIDYRLFPTGCLLGLHSCHACMFSMVVLVISEAFALGMILVKASQMRNSTMMQRISEDGIFYFIIVICASIANIVALNVSPPTLCNFLLATQSALQSICCNHLLLRIRGSGLGSSLSFKATARPLSRVQSDGQMFSNDTELASAETWAIPRPSHCRLESS